MQCTQLILIADDNNDVLNVLTPTLGDFFEVMEARTGKEAVELYAKHRPDIVIMDYVMPDMNGAEAIRKILNLDEHAKIIGITGYSPEGRVEMIRAGAIEVVEKPFKVINVIEAVSRYVKQISNGVTSQRMFIVEREIANVRMEHVNTRAQVEQLRLSIQNATKLFFKGAKKYGGIGVITYNLISVLLNVVAGVVKNPSTFVSYVTNNAPLVVATSVGLLLGLLFLTPYIYRKVFKRKETKEYLFEFSGLTSDVNSFVHNNMSNKNKKIRKGSNGRRLI